MSKKRNDKYTTEQTNAIIKEFANINSYEQQILIAQKLADSELFSEWNFSHSAKQILAKVRNMSKPPVEPVLTYTYITRPKPDKKLPALNCHQIMQIIEELAGYNVFNRNGQDKNMYNVYSIARYVAVDIILLLLSREVPKSRIGILADECKKLEFGEAFDLSEFELMPVQS